MTSYLDRYLAGEREAVWRELTALGPAIATEPLASDARAVARETMRRARANVELLAQRLTTLGYRFVLTVLGDPPRPYAPPSDESLATLRALEAQYGLLPLSITTWFEIVGAVDFIGVYPRLSSYEVIDHNNLIIRLHGQDVRVSRMPDGGYHILGPAPEPDPDPDAGLPTDPLVIWPPHEALIEEWPVDEDEDADEDAMRYRLSLAPDALHKANVSGGDGPCADFSPERRMDAPLGGDDWDGALFIDYLRIAFAWGGFPGLRAAKNPPCDLLASLCEGLLPL